MITEKQINEIVSLYTKFGWTTRRILLSGPHFAANAESLRKKYEPAEVVESKIDAVWFSRPSEGEKEAWELRRVSETPYALFELFESDDEEEIRDETRSEMEERMGQAL